MKIFLTILGLVAIFFTVVMWAVCVANNDSEDSCDTAQCGGCPFPCEKHNYEEEDLND